MTSCNLSRKDGSNGHIWAEAIALVNRANDAAQRSLISDQALVDARSESRQLFFISGAGETPHAQPIGLVILSKDEFDLVIDPAYERNGFGGCALEQVLNVTSGNLRVWVHGDQPAAQKLLTRNLFRVQRTLLMMRASRDELLQKRDLLEGTREPLAAGFTVETFADSDADDWVALNATVFAEHPEQGSLTRADLDARRAEPWFNPHHFLLLRNSARELIGYCWMKVIGSEAELYVIGIDPAYAGKSLGSTLLDRALAAMLTLTDDSSTAPKPLIDDVSLYVDEENTAAVALYSSRGFSRARTSRYWMLTRR